MRYLLRALPAATVALLLTTPLLTAATRLDGKAPAAAQLHVTCLKAASFKRLPAGWSQQSAGCASSFAPGSLSAWTQATSWRYSSDPNGPIHQMRPNRVLISVILSRPPGFPKTVRVPPLSRLPLNLANADEIADEEGSPKMPQYRFFRRVSCQYDIDVRVDFGRPHPTGTMLRAAQRALDGLALHRWNIHC